MESIKTIADFRAENKLPEILFWVGCAGSYDARAQKVSKAFAQVMQAAGIHFAILGDEEKCTGDPARRAGNEFLFQMLAIQKNGGPELIESYLPRIESISGISSIAWSYRRKSATGHGAWYVTQYKVPCTSILVELTISYRESDSALWKPILRKVRESVRIQDCSVS